ncbi:MAG: acyl carrier protein [Terrimicrobiaceae bacterium]|nr:acyl carrier protein [Terrimicrobiaceae bacterium]
METRIKRVMASVFGIEESQIGDDSSSETIEEWDSLRQMNLILALEEEFGIRFSDEETLETLSLRQFIDVIGSKTTAG